MPLTKYEQIWLRDVLGKTGFYKFLSPPEIEQLHDRMSVLSYEQGEKIIKEGAAGGAFYILAHGRVGIVKESEKGGQQSLAEIEGANFFGEISLLTAAPRTTSVVAIEDVKLFTIGKRDFADLFMRNPQIKKILEKHGRDRSTDTRRKAHKDTFEPADTMEGKKAPFAERILGTFKQLVAPAAAPGSTAFRTGIIDDSEAEEQVQQISDLLRREKSDNWLVNNDT